MDDSGQLHVLAALPWGKNSSFILGSWVGPKIYDYFREEHTGNRILGRPAHSLVTILTVLSRLNNDLKGALKHFVRFAIHRFVPEPAAPIPATTGF
jgi:hypothetical protein